MTAVSVQTEQPECAVSIPTQQGRSHQDVLLARVAAARARYQALTCDGLWPEDSPVVCPEMASALYL